MAETGLPRARLEGERGRTTGQLRLFASVLRDGGFLEARIDPAMPDRKPLPRPDLRLRNVPLGPVAVFGASNFPLAFSVAGGDTASALAAGCPVIVKAHPAHPGTSELVGRAIQAAVASVGLHPGVFSMIHDSGYEISAGLVADPRVKAAGFTGSRRGGLALAGHRPGPARADPVLRRDEQHQPGDPAARRPEGARRQDRPGLRGRPDPGRGPVLHQSRPDPGHRRSRAGRLRRRRRQGGRGRPGRRHADPRHLQGLRPRRLGPVGPQGGHHRGARPARRPRQPHRPRRPVQRRGRDFLANPHLHEEVFGAASLVVRAADQAELAKVIDALEGQLTIAVHMDEADHALAGALLPALELKAGRILVNGFGTGVEVAHAMVHGGPFPSTSDAKATSVGTRTGDRAVPAAGQLPEPAGSAAAGRAADGEPAGHRPRRSMAR
jgi:alpha-ketoglutaric semialdehyde dehydrogenase